MSLRDFLANVSVILTVMAAAALIETAVPMFMAKPWKHSRRLAKVILPDGEHIAAAWLLRRGLTAIDVKLDRLERLQKTRELLFEPGNGASHPLRHLHLWWV